MSALQAEAAFEGPATDDQVIQHLDFQEVAGPDQIPGHPDVGFGGSGIPGRVVVG
jgi:hypothetical protein